MGRHRTYYRILGVPRGESDANIRSAYRRLAQQYHPDRAGPGSTASFQELNEAYETLCDPDKRAAYDAKLSRDGRRTRNPQGDGSVSGSATASGPATASGSATASGFSSASASASASTFWEPGRVRAAPRPRPRTRTRTRWERGGGAAGPAVSGPWSGSGSVWPDDRWGPGGLRGRSPVDPLGAPEPLIPDSPRGAPRPGGQSAPARGPYGPSARSGSHSEPRFKGPGPHPHSHRSGGSATRVGRDAGGEVLTMEVSLSPAVAQRGAVLELGLPTWVPCPLCRGAGVTRRGALGRCRRCGGHGEVEQRVPVRVRVPAGARQGALIPVPTEELGLLGPPLWLRVRLVG